jgi:hypothetical protein
LGRKTKIIDRKDLSSFEVFFVSVIEKKTLENSRLENFENLWFFWFENSEFFVSNPSFSTSYSLPSIFFKV